MSLENIESLKFLQEQYKIKGRNNILLVWRILHVVKGYTRLTVRQLWYILISRFKYSATKAAYKRMDRYLCKIRRANPEVNIKFIDPTRHFVPAPQPYPKMEIYVEKDSIRNFISELAVKYQLNIQVLRGFASLSMYRKAIERARKRGVTNVLYIGDFDPSGLLIETIANEEMNDKTGINFHRIAITKDQIRRFRPPSRPVNIKDSRAQAYIKNYGERVWDVEAIKPRTLYRLIELGLRAAVPPEFLVKAKMGEKARRIARPVTERLRNNIEREVGYLIEVGLPEREILAIISKQYTFPKRN